MVQSNKNGEFMLWKFSNAMLKTLDFSLGGKEGLYYKQGGRPKGRRNSPQ